MTYSTTINVDPKRVQDMIIGAFEGGSNYWIEGVTLMHPKREDLIPEEVVWYGREQNVFAMPDFRVMIQDEEGEHTLDAEAVRRGIEVMAAECPRHFADMVSENDDATTSDVFLQCCLFGELVYG